MLSSRLAGSWKKLHISIRRCKSATPRRRCRQLRACRVARDSVACAGAGCPPQRRTCTGTCRRSDRNSQPQILMKRWGMCACFTAVRGILQIKSEAEPHWVCAAAGLRSRIDRMFKWSFKRCIWSLEKNYIAARTLSFIAKEIVRNKFNWQYNP